MLAADEAERLATLAAEEAELPATLVAEVSDLLAEEAPTPSCWPIQLT